MPDYLLNNQKQSDGEEGDDPAPDEPTPTSTSYDVENPHPTMSEAANSSPGSGKPTSKIVENPHSIYVSETTPAKITTVNVKNGKIKYLRNLDQSVEKTKYMPAEEEPNE